MLKNMRSAIIRVSAINQINKDNDSISVKAGDYVIYTIGDIVATLDEWTKTKFFHYYVIAHKSFLFQ